MAKALKVFGGTWCGIERRIVATTSLAKAAELTGCPRGYICVTGNSLELEVARSNPGVAYGCNLSAVHSPSLPREFILISDKHQTVDLQPGIDKPIP